MATRLILSVLLCLLGVSSSVAAETPVTKPAPSAAAPVAEPPKAPDTQPKEAPAAAAAPLPKVSEADPKECATFMAALKKRPRLSEAERNADANKQAEASLKVCARADTAVLNGGAVGTDLVRTVSQVVVDKVQRQGWVALRDELVRIARCPRAPGDAPSPSYPNLCRVLDTAAIQDLVAAPEVLLDAVAADLLGVALQSAKLNANAQAALGEFLSRLPVSHEGDSDPATARLSADLVVGSILSAHRLGAEVLLRRWQQVLLQKARNQALESLECDPKWTSPVQALWVSGMCFIERPHKEALLTCDFESWVAKCAPPATDPPQPLTDKSEKVLLFLTSAQDVLTSKASSGRAEATIRLVFELAEAHVSETLAQGPREEALRWLSAFEDMMLGLIQKDWVRVVSGATRVAIEVIEKSADCSPPAGTELDASACEERKANETKLLALIGAVGNYALTYKNDDTEKAQADREKIMSELVDRMVSRTSKERGVKFSLGGSLGLLGGVRTDFGAAQVAFPVQLGLGFGLQSYHSNTGGFHLMATVLDVGQYVSIENDQLIVEEPDVESAVTLGLTLGGWVWNREVPFYIAAYGGISPFVKTEGDPTFQLGLATGFYAPLLDFN